MMKNENDDFDWFKWAGIEALPRDKLLSEAKVEGIPVFNSDSDKDLYDRILTSKTFKNNKSTLFINKVLASISFVSAIVAVLALFSKY